MGWNGPLHGEVLGWEAVSGLASLRVSAGGVDPTVPSTLKRMEDRNVAFLILKFRRYFSDV